MLDSYRFLEEDKEEVRVTGTSLTIEQVLYDLGLEKSKDFDVTKVSDSDITKLLEAPKYSFLNEGSVREVIDYFNTRSYEVKKEIKRKALAKRHRSNVRSLIQQTIEAERITAEDLMITINAR